MCALYMHINDRWTMWKSSVATCSVCVIANHHLDKGTIQRGNDFWDLEMMKEGWELKTWYLGLAGWLAGWHYYRGTCILTHT